ncbi:hypothetical protein Leryth_006761 [Lithospermum erythrorhizon]|nr:hypothetical protein Leryth_006761 [Lithospermum erythrorhizon]
MSLTVDLAPTMVHQSQHTVQQSRHTVLLLTTTISKSTAVISCSAMAILYVAILYSPTLILRLPPPTSFKSFLLRRFVCAAISSAVSIIAAAFLLPVNWEAIEILGAFGIRLDHTKQWQAVIYPLFLTSLMYAGSLILKALLVLDALSYEGQRLSMSDYIKGAFVTFIDWMSSMVSNVGAWRNYVVAPVTEELVFRACMIPLLLCGGFSTYAVIFLCPIFFSLAHLNHFLELYTQQKLSFLRASSIVGFQLGYTVVFGSYASFLFVRTGNLISPLIAHIFCNFMGLPAMFSRRTGIVTLAFVAGVLGFLWLLVPLTSPHLYNYRTDNCKCWHRYCDWTL